MKHSLLIAALENGSMSDVLDFFEGMTEKDRRQLAPVVVDWIKKNRLSLSDCLPSQKDNDESAGKAALVRYKNRFMACQTALASTASFPELKSYFGKFLDNSFIHFPLNDPVVAPYRWDYEAILPWRSGLMPEVIFAVFRQRAPSFATDYILFLVENEVGNNRDFYDECVRRELCPHLCNELLIYHLVCRLVMDKTRWNNQLTLWGTDIDPSYLQQHPEYYGQEFWYIFEHEFQSHRIPFNTHLRQKNKISFPQMFKEAVDSGKMDRSRLLNDLLAVLDYHYTEYDLKWYWNLYLLLDPSPAEHQQREDKYYHLAGSDTAGVRQFAMGCLTVLLEKGQTDLARFAEMAGTPPRRLESGTAAMKRLALLRRLVTEKKVPLETVLNGILDLQIHPTASVQTAACRLLNELAPELRKKETKKTVTATKTATELVTTENDNVTEYVPLSPLQTAEELLDCFVAILARGEKGEPDQLELFLDGVSRLWNQKDKDFSSKVSPLAKAFGKMYWEAKSGPKSDSAPGECNGADGSVLPVALYLAGFWISEKVTLQGIQFEMTISRKGYSGNFRFEYTDPNPWNRKKQAVYSQAIPQLFARLVYEIAERISTGQTCPLLSTPSHQNGWLDPLVLADRILSAPPDGASAGLTDQILSLYRLLPQNRQEALKRLATHLPGDPYLETLRAILSGNSHRNESLPLFWEVARQYSLQTATGQDWDLKCVPERKLDNLYAFDMTGSSPSDNGFNLLDLPKKSKDLYRYPLLFFRKSPRFHESYDRRLTLHWLSNLFPAFRQPLYLLGLNPHPELLCATSSTDGPDYYLYPLERRGEPAPALALRLLLYNMTAKSDTLAGYARDILARLITDRQVSHDAIARQAEILLADKESDLVFSRWTSRFKQIGTLSPDHARTIMEAAKRIAVKSTPRNAAGLNKITFE